MAGQSEGRYLSVQAEVSLAKEKVSSLLRSLHHGDSGIKPLKLFYIPYFFFSFDAFENRDSKTAILASGSDALNAHTRKLDHRVAYITSSSPQRQDAPQPDATVLEPKLGLEDAKAILPVIMSSQHGTLKDNVIVSGLDFAYVPFWKIPVEVQGNTVEFEMNAVNGRILNAGKIKPRKKSTREIMAETAQELAHPSAWLKYSSELLSDIIAVGSAAANPHPAQGKEPHGKAKAETAGFQLDEQAVIFGLAIVAVVVAIWVFFLR